MYYELHSCRDAVRTRIGGQAGGTGGKLILPCLTSRDEFAFELEPFSIDRQAGSRIPSFRRAIVASSQNGREIVMKLLLLNGSQGLGSRVGRILQKVLPVLLALLMSSALHASERVALVIGVDEYQSAAQLKNAVSDAKLVSEVLKKADFDVIALENPGIDSIYRGLEQLKRRGPTASVAIVYFAGHGIEVQGKNYLLPVDVELADAVQLRSQTIALRTVLSDLQEARFPAKVVILDCCRDNPLQRSWMTSRSLGRGLAPLMDTDMPDASLVVYSASPGRAALDGSDGNSPFTKALAVRLQQPGLDLFQAFLKTSDDVADSTAGTQEPWIKMDAAGRAIRKLVLVPESDTGVEPSAPSVPKERIAAKEPDQSKPEKEVDMPPAAMKTESQIGQVSTGKPTFSDTEASPAPHGKPAPLELPSRGYFSNAEVFESGPYAKYNSYSKTKILRKAQEMLPGSGEPDGQMGPNTQVALQAYQEEQSLPVTGRLDNATIEKMKLGGLPDETYEAPRRATTSSYRSSTSSQSAPPASSNSLSETKKKGGFYKPPSDDGSRKPSHANKKFSRPG